MWTNLKVVRKIIPKQKKNRFIHNLFPEKALENSGEPQTKCEISKEYMKCLAVAEKDVDVSRTIFFYLQLQCDDFFFFFSVQYLCILNEKLETMY